jgi:hypothetical protein
MFYVKFQPTSLRMWLQHIALKGFKNNKAEI